MYLLQGPFLVRWLAEAGDVGNRQVDALPDRIVRALAPPDGSRQA